MGNHDKCLTFVRNLHSNHVYIRGPSGNIMAAIFHKSRKRFTKKKKKEKKNTDQSYERRNENPEINTTPQNFRS